MSSSSEDSGFSSRVSTPDTKNALREKKLNELAGNIVIHYKKLSHKLLLEHERQGRPRTSPSWSEVCSTVLANASVRETDAAGLIKYLGRLGGDEAALGAFDFFLGLLGPNVLPPQAYHAAIGACATNFAHEKAMQVFTKMKEAAASKSAGGWPVTTSGIGTYNMLIASLAQAGRVSDTFEVYRQMKAEGLKPNSFTFELLVQACNFKRRGMYREALQVYSWAQKEGHPTQGVALGVLDAIRAAVQKSPTLDESLAALDAARDAGLAAQDVSLYSAAIRAAARARDAEHAIAIFEEFERDCPDVSATRDVYEALIEAMVASGDIEGAFVAFEWMNEGRGRLPTGEIPGAPVFNLLLRACHQRVLLEKALEVLTWMDAYGIEAEPQLYDEVVQAVDMSEIWDVRVLRPNPRAHAANVRRLGGPARLEDLRPAPYDGLRMVYLDDFGERTEEAALAGVKLGSTGWAPSTMNLRDAPLNAPPPGSPAALSPGAHQADLAALTARLSTSRLSPLRPNRGSTAARRRLEALSASGGRPGSGSAGLHATGGAEKRAEGGAAAAGPGPGSQPASRDASPLRSASARAAHASKAPAAAAGTAGMSIGGAAPAALATAPAAGSGASPLRRGVRPPSQGRSSIGAGVRRKVVPKPGASSNYSSPNAASLPRIGRTAGGVGPGSPRSPRGQGAAGAGVGVGAGMAVPGAAGLGLAVRGVAGQV